LLRDNKKGPRSFVAGPFFISTALSLAYWP
jgi:hypothetical protein